MEEIFSNTLRIPQTILLGKVIKIKKKFKKLELEQKFQNQFVKSNKMKILNSFVTIIIFLVVVVREMLLINTQKSSKKKPPRIKTNSVLGDQENFFEFGKILKIYLSYLTKKKFCNTNIIIDVCFF